jgi:hypothetical protein
VQVARLFLLCGILSLGALPSCGASEYGDLPADPIIPPPAGKGDRIHEIANPRSTKKAAHKTPVNVSGAVVIALDQYDETHNGRSATAIYVADLGSKQPYSGISLFNPSFIPGNLRVGPGDTLDLRGEYQENQDIPVKFAPKSFLVQLASPIGTFRFDAKVTDPVDIDPNPDCPDCKGIDELADYTLGRKWLNMLVRVKNVTVERDTNGTSASGRISSGLCVTKAGQDPCENAPPEPASKCEDPFPKKPTLVNELMDLAPLDLKKGDVIKELVGVVTFFCNLHIAPRSAADVVK